MLLCALLLACGRKASTSPDVCSVLPAVSAQALDLNGFCDAAVAPFCCFLARCYPKAAHTLPADCIAGEGRAMCAAAFSDDVRAAVAAGRAEFDPVAAAGCIADLGNGQCTPDVLTRCSNVVFATTTPSQVCGSSGNSEFDIPRFDVKLACAPGTSCAPPANPCGASGCGPGTKTVGEPCVTIADCAPGLTCLGESLVCGPFREQGEACTVPAYGCPNRGGAPRDGRPGGDCAIGLACTTTSPTRNCDLPQPGVCVRRPTQSGEACTVPCFAPGLYCVNGLCGGLPGGLCSFGFPCRPSDYCYQVVPRLLPAAGKSPAARRRRRRT